MTCFPFTGSIEFQLSIKALGVSVIRQACLDYAYVPPWSYFDLQAGLERTGEVRLEAQLRVLVRGKFGIGPEPSSSRPWAPASQLLAAGVLSKRLINQLRQQVDTQARETDRRNRLRAGRAAPALPEQI